MGRHRGGGPVPERWLDCPRKSNILIVDKFLAMKTPLGPHFDDKVPEANRFHPSMIFAWAKAQKVLVNNLWFSF